ncbi:hypothetical protein [Streptomyces specialis]|uniref:hypothetical protein n=1 Tax=Streptomyces specialis TaxID=498367 RepID=UPI000ABAAE57|nr:hypothetical protein [Streptomyces specialis]
MALPLIAAAGAAFKIAKSVYEWTQKTPQGRATMASAGLLAAYQHTKAHPNDSLNGHHIGEASKRFGQDVVNPTVSSLYQHIRKDLT